MGLEDKMIVLLLISLFVNLIFIIAIACLRDDIKNISIWIQTATTTIKAQNELISTQAQYLALDDEIFKMEERLERN